MPMNDEEAARLAYLETNLRTVTDRIGQLVDQAQQRGYVPVFRCGHSGLYFPGDYVREWGRLYGIGLGVDPVSEVLDTDYSTAPPEITPDIRHIEQIMHPVMVSRAQVDLLMVPPAEYADRRAVLASEDETVEVRARIIRPRQLANPRGRLRLMQAKWEGT